MQEATLDVLVENMGHINYGPMIGRDFKGITAPVITRFSRVEKEWQTWILPQAPPEKLPFGPFAMTDNQPAFHCADFNVEECCDTFLKFPGIKGSVWINGFHLGRYWNKGPADALYLPAPLLKKGKNRIIVLELHQLNGNGIVFSDRQRFQIGT